MVEELYTRESPRDFKELNFFDRIEESEQMCKHNKFKCRKQPFSVEKNTRKSMRRNREWEWFSEGSQWEPVNVLRKTKWVNDSWNLVCQHILSKWFEKCDSSYQISEEAISDS